MLLVSRRGADVGPLSRRLVPELEREVEVLRPQLHRRRIAVGLLGAQLLQHRAGEAVEITQHPRGTGVHLEPLERPAAGSRSSPSPRWRTSSGPSTRTWQSWPPSRKKGVPKPPRVKRSAISFSGIRAGATTSSATRCSARRVSANPPGSGSSGFQAPSQRSAHQSAISGRSAATWSQVRSPWSLTGETSLRPSGTSPGATGSSAKGSTSTAGGEGSSTLRLEVAAQDVLGLGSGVAHGGP